MYGINSNAPALALTSDALSEGALSLVVITASAANAREDDRCKFAHEMIQQQQMMQEHMQLVEDSAARSQMEESRIANQSMDAMRSMQIERAQMEAELKKNITALEQAANARQQELKYSQNCTSKKNQKALNGNQCSGKCKKKKHSDKQRIDEIS